MLLLRSGLDDLRNGNQGWIAFIAMKKESIGASQSKRKGSKDQCFVIMKNETSQGDTEVEAKDAREVEATQKGTESTKESRQNINGSQLWMRFMSCTKRNRSKS